MISKSDNCKVGVWFVYHKYDYRQNWLLPINHNFYNFWKKKLINLMQTSSVILEISLFFLDKLLLSWLFWLILWMVDLDDLWLAALTVWLQASNCSQLSDYTVQLWLYRMISGKLSSKCTNHIEEIVMVMNNQLIPFWTPSIVSDKAKNEFCFSKEKLVHKNTLIKFKRMF